jgi:chromosome segregation ATPase
MQEDCNVARSSVDLMALASSIPDIGGEWAEMVKNCGAMGAQAVRQLEQRLLESGKIQSWISLSQQSRADFLDQASTAQKMLDTQWRKAERLELAAAEVRVRYQDLESQHASLRESSENSAAELQAQLKVSAERVALQKAAADENSNKLLLAEQLRGALEEEQHQLQKALHGVESESVQTSELVEALEMRLHREQDKSASTKEELDGVRSQHAAALLAITSSLDSAVDQAAGLSSEMEAGKRECMRVAAELKTRDDETIPELRKEIGKAAAQVRGLQQERSCWEKERGEWDAERETLSQQLEILRNRLEDTTQIAEVLRNECKAARAERDDAGVQLAQAERDIQERDAIQSQAKAELARVQALAAQELQEKCGAIDVFKTQLQEASSLMENLGSAKFALEQQLRREQGEKDTQQALLAEISSQQEPLKQKVFVLDEERARLSSDNMRLQLKVDILEEHCSDEDKIRIEEKCDTAFERKQLEQQLDQVKSSTNNMSTELAHLRVLSSEQQDQLSRLKLQLSDGEIVRRRQHEIISELRGPYMRACREPPNS